MSTTERVEMYLRNTDIRRIREADCVDYLHTSLSKFRRDLLGEGTCYSELRDK